MNFLCLDKPITSGHSSLSISHINYRKYHEKEIVASQAIKKTNIIVFCGPFLTKDLVRIIKLLNELNCFRSVNELILM